MPSTVTRTALSTGSSDHGTDGEGGGACRERQHELQAADQGSAEPPGGHAGQATPPTRSRSASFSSASSSSLVGLVLVLVALVLVLVALVLVLAALVLVGLVLVLAALVLVGLVLVDSVPVGLVRFQLHHGRRRVLRRFGGVRGRRARGERHAKGDDHEGGLGTGERPCGVRRSSWWPWDFPFSRMVRLPDGLPSRSSVGARRALAASRLARHDPPASTQSP